MAHDQPEFEIRVCDQWVRLYRYRTNELEWHLTWNEITRISAWKRDLFVVDQICMGFQWDDCEEIVKWVTEETPGWDDLQRAIEKQFGVKVSDWWRGVAFPPFDTNFTVVWERNAISHGG